MYANLFERYKGIEEMTEAVIKKIIHRWKMVDAYVLGVAVKEDMEIWQQTCEISSFRTSFSYYTSVESTYQGMLSNVNYFLNNCSPQGLVGFIKFYESQSGITYRDLYQSDVNTFKSGDRNFNRDTDWWTEHIDDFREKVVSIYKEQV